MRAKIPCFRVFTSEEVETLKPDSRFALLPVPVKLRTALSINDPGYWMAEAGAANIPRIEEPTLVCIIEWHSVDLVLTWHRLKDKHNPEPTMLRSQLEVRDQGGMGCCGKLAI